MQMLQYLRWIIYLRKSRQDDPNQTVEEVLAKHEAILQEFARKELGGEIPAENIYREVISGESIAERSEIKKVLVRIEDPAILGVLVVEPSRLSRGDLKDCAQIIDAFQFSKTLVGTPMMTYNLENKMERKFFQDELLRGNDYLEYTKEILFRGRTAAVKRGCYISQTAPYGYDKIKIGKDHTLEPNDDADTVRMIFDWYANEKISPLQIAKRLTAMGIASPTGGSTWHKETVRSMLKNRHYIGLVFYSQRKLTPMLEGGEIIKKKVFQPDKDVVVAQGKHEAIIGQELWDKAQTRYSLPRRKLDLKLTNPLAGLLICSNCKKALRYGPHSHAEDRYNCVGIPQCYKSVKVRELLEALTHALEHSELPELKLKVENGDGNARKIQEKQLAKLEKQMEEYREQEENQYELLETKVYTQDVFDRRNAKLRAKIEECQSAIYKTKSSLPENVDYEERIVTLEQAIAALKNNELTADQKNKILKSIVEKIEYTSIPTGQGKKGKTPFTLEIFLKL